MIDYKKLKQFRFPAVEQEYADHDTFLYALAVGVGQNPTDAEALKFVYERDSRVLPSFATVLGALGMWTAAHPELGIDYEQMVHGEQRVTFHRPFPSSATIVGQSAIARVVDKGAGKGALVHVSRTIKDKASDELFATIEYVLFCRADGGFGATGSSSDEPGDALAPTPVSAPEFEVPWETRPETALLYRLTGDRNALHADPTVAARAGFRQPILHGLATYGVACAALLRTFCANEPARLKSMACRFSSPVFPGENLILQAWRAGQNVAFRVLVPQRNVVAISFGNATIDFL